MNDSQREVIHWNRRVPTLKLLLGGLLPLLVDYSQTCKLLVSDAGIYGGGR